MVDVSRSDNEQPVPTIWRTTLFRIVESFKCGDYLTSSGIDGVSPLSDSDAKLIEKSIRSYGCSLIDLPKESWNTSVCQWTGHHWDVMVDIFTEEEGLSDLVMFARVNDDGDEYSFTVDSVHVP